MGTRHLVAAIVDNEFRVAQYGQFDGYPTGQGQDLVDYLRKVDISELYERVKQVRFANDEDIETVRELLNQFNKMLPDYEGYEELERKLEPFAPSCSSEIFEYLMDNPDCLPLKDNSNFGKDSLFCEWAYIVNFDTNSLEVYKGFNMNPVPESNPFAKGFVPHVPAYRAGEDPYHPVSLVAEYPLNDLPVSISDLED
tara:strand:- start:28 stop:618 length:591 start_codon:yes stop_codon:yes gene_type:complete